MKSHSIVAKFKQLSFVSIAAVLSSFTMLGMAGVAFADDPAACTTPGSSQSGVHSPVGADAGTYTYQCSGPYAGEWTNPYYVYNPATGGRSALYDPAYSYDCANGTWTMTQWNYSPGAGKFVSSRVAPPTAPNLPTGCAPAAAAAPATGTNTDPAGGTSSANPTTTGSSGSAVTVADSGPGSNNTANNNVNLNGTVTNNTGIGMANTINSDANTGETAVVGNTTGGSASTGNASDVANIANLLQSTSNAFGPGTTVFTANIDGDVNGDFMFDPAAILASGPGSNNTANNNLQVNTNTSNTTDAAINNDINVGATSGNATVAENTAGGDATSGNASAVVNLMNLINSTVASGQSFVGTININGDLNGDILLPQGVLDQLLASSTGPGSNNTATNNLSTTSTTTNNVTEAATNNITSNAATGSANVSGNTGAGSATSGSSGNNITLLNLTGSNTIGKDDLLVFVNVLGKWVGMIMNAPSGSTAADLGGGITSSGPNSNNNTANTVSDNSKTTNNANLGITNNVNVHAKSGDANVVNNTAGGNAKTGNANTAVNILNLEGSNLSLSDWFGVLFINVFGIWNGSFGVNTSAGDPVAANPSSPTNNPVQASTQKALLTTFHRLTGFTLGSTGTGSGNSSNGNSAGNVDTTGDFQNAAVLGSATGSKKISAAATVNRPTADNAPHASYSLPLIGFALAALILLAGERDRIVSLLRRKH